MIKCIKCGKRYTNYELIYGKKDFKIDVIEELLICDDCEEKTEKPLQSLEHVYI